MPESLGRVIRRALYCAILALLLVGQGGGAALAAVEPTDEQIAVYEAMNEAQRVKLLIEL
ncbi:MAG: hypothetical protein JNM20_13885, partial [Rhizobiales bacterium]|nr:hypothetical protein [Hyphomicrobiales bacterium]